MGGLAPCQWANAYTRFGEIWLDKCGHPLDKCGHRASPIDIIHIGSVWSQSPATGQRPTSSGDDPMAQTPEVLIFSRDGRSAVLTTDSTASNYDFGALRFRGPGLESSSDLRPADALPEGMSFLGLGPCTAARFVTNEIGTRRNSAAIGIGKELTAEELSFVRRWLSTWPDGPKLFGDC